MERRPSSRSTSRDMKRRRSPDSRVRLPRFPSSSPRSSARWRSCAWNAAPRWATRGSMPRSAKSRSSRSRSGAPGRRLPPGSARCRRRRIPETFMRRWAERSRPAILLIIAAASLFAGFAAATANAADELAVDVVNASEPTLCAEHDNVTLKLASDKVRRFGIEAAHPAYIGTLVADRAAADFSQCDFSVDPAAARASALERLWLLVPGGTDRDGRAAVRRSDRHRVRSGRAELRAQVRARRRRQSEVSEARPRPYRARRRPRSRRWPAVRGAALDVRDGDQRRRRPDRLARAGRQSLARNADRSLRTRERGRAPGRPRGPLPPQFKRARPAVLGVRRGAALRGTGAPSLAPARTVTAGRRRCAPCSPYRVGSARLRAPGSATPAPDWGYPRR